MLLSKINKLIGRNSSIISNNEVINIFVIRIMIKVISAQFNTKLIDNRGNEINLYIRDYKG